MKILTTKADLADFLTVATEGYWYLASPYAGHPGGYDKAYEEVAELTANLMRLNYVIFSPINHCHPIAHKYKLPREFDFWMNYDVVMVREALGLLVADLPGWQKSTGVSSEITAAKFGQKPYALISQQLIGVLHYDTK